MNMVAAGSYIRTLREQRRLTQDAVIARAAEQLNGRKIDPTTLWRIESGLRKTRSDILSAVVEAVEGNGDDVSRLMRDPNATADDGKSTALALLTAEQRQRIDRIVEGTDPADLAAIIEELRDEYQQSPSLLTFLRGALAGWRARGGGDRSH
jgi:transcriptional regulator with XRE-family HTH domain